MWTMFGRALTRGRPSLRTTLKVTEEVAPMTRKVDRLTMRPSTAVVRIAPTATQLYG